MRVLIQKYGMRIFIALVILATVASIAAVPPGDAENWNSQPTAELTVRPTLEPTREPAIEPTIVPTAEPTAEPTPEPTAKPTAKPSARPGGGRKIDPDRPMIALSFDDGPGPGTRRILRALEKVGGRATFCMVGDRVEQYAETARMVARQGNEIATHTWSHPNLSKLSAMDVRRELNRSISAIEKVTGVRPRVLRPPYGSANDTVRSVTRDMGVVIANWNVDTEDWKSRDADAIRRHVIANARDGAIVLSHDLYAETAEAMEGAVVELAKRGYQLVTVSELLEARAGGGRAGQVYYAG